MRQTEPRPPDSRNRLASAGSRSRGTVCTLATSSHGNTLGSGWLPNCGPQADASALAMDLWPRRKRASSDTYGDRGCEVIDERSQQDEGNRGYRAPTRADDQVSESAEVGMHVTPAIQPQPRRRLRVQGSGGEKPRRVPTRGLEAGNEGRRDVSATPMCLESWWSQIQAPRVTHKPSSMRKSHRGDVREVCRGRRGRTY